MAKRLLFLIGLGLGFSMVGVEAQELKPTDFAFGYEVTFTSGQSLYEVRLPKEVYQTVTRTDLGDLRVFNANESVVPHQLQPFQEEHVEDEVAPPMLLNLFPILGVPMKGKDLSHVKVETKEDGTIVSVSTEDAGSEGETKPITAFLVDASHVEEKMDRLVFDVTRPNDAGYLRKVTIAASSDLQSWRTVRRDAVLADLAFENQRLVRRTVEFPPQKEKYYRISWPAHDPELLVVSVQGRQPKTKRWTEPALSWHRVEGVSHSTERNVFTYDLKGTFLVQRVRLLFRDANAIAQVELKAAKHPGGPWVTQGSDLLYVMSKGESKIENRELSVRSGRFRYWRMDVSSGVAGLGEAAPILEFGWLPEKVRFLARGKSPFLIAFGRVNTDPFDSVILGNKLWKDSVSQATVGSRVVLGGADRLIPVPSHPWKKWTLWSVLVIGVLAMGTMARQLLKTMKQE